MQFKQTLTFSFALLLGALCCDTNAKERARSYYLIGNSLTWDTVPSRLDGDVQWHVDCGVSLPHIHKNPQKPCVKTSTLWPKALKGKQYSYLSMQPHYGSTLAEDVDVISKFMGMQPKAIVVIHTGWARQASRAEEHASKDIKAKLVHSPAYFNALLAELKKTHPKREIRLSHAQGLLQRVAEDIAAGKAPFKDVNELYRDKVHMKLDTGRYLMHNAMRHALDQPYSSKGYQKLDPKMKKYLDGVLATLKRKKD